LIEHAACNDLALSPNYTIDHTLWAYMMGQGLLRSTNGGDTWSVLSNDFVVETLLASPNYAADQTLFASTSDARLLKSIDGGTHWTTVLYYTVTSLAISPAYGASQTVYAGVKEMPNSSGAIYRSGDGGAHWQKLATGIRRARTISRPSSVRSNSPKMDHSSSASHTARRTATCIARSMAAKRGRRGAISATAACSICWRNRMRVKAISAALSHSWPVRHTRSIGAISSSAIRPSPAYGTASARLAVAPTSWSFRPTLPTTV
jgi:hypothetical protein